MPNLDRRQEAGSPRRFERRWPLGEDGAEHACADCELELCKDVQFVHAHSRTQRLALRPLHDAVSHARAGRGWAAAARASQEVSSSAVFTAQVS